MSKLGIVIRHEYLTIVKQPSFWITMLAVPLIIGVVFALMYIGGKSSEERIEKLSKELKSVAIIDNSGLIRKEVVESAGLTLSSADQEKSLREQVRSANKEALIVYPKDLQKDRKYAVYLSSSDFTKMGSVTSLSENILKTSVYLPLGSADVIALAQNGAESQVTTYKNGNETAGLNEYIVPGLFIVLFYIVFAFSVGYMLSSVSEEKENRSMEMVLTYVKPRVLIVGKLLAVILVTLTQILFFALVGITGLLIALSLGTNLPLPAGVDLQRLVFDPVAIFFGASFLIVGFLMFAGFMTATAAMAPSSKEANSFSAIFYIGAFIPFYFVTLILTNPDSPVVKAITFFPLTSPVVNLLRNTIGNIGIVEATLSLVVMIAFMLLSVWIAIRAFSQGALEYSSVIKLQSLFKK